MFELFLNLAYLGALAISPTINVHNVQATPNPERNQVVAVEFKKWWSSSESACRFKGVYVAFVRDWEEVITDPAQGTETRFPPEPDKIHAYAIVLNLKTCPGKADEPLSHIATFGGGFFGRMPDGLQIHARNVIELKGEERPKWIDQVSGIIAKAEATQPAAKEFLETNRRFTATAKNPGEAKADTAKPAAEKPAEAVPAK